MAPEPLPEPDIASAADFERYVKTVERTHTLIDLDTDRSSGREAARERAIHRMGRLTSLLEALGQPHRTVPIVHVAGTSGKGSTATAIAAGLTAAGYRTALHTSPYLQSATEKLQLDGRLIAAGEFAQLVDATIAASEDVPAFKSTPISYGELWMAMVLRWFADVSADVAVLETGAGGRFDLSNVVSPVISVITTIGLDHLETLGPTIADVAWHKAGIIKQGVPVVTGVRDPEALEVIVREAAAMGSRLVFPDWHDRLAGAEGDDLGIAIAPFQRANQALAAATLRQMGMIGFTIDQEASERGVAGMQLPGRAEVMQDEPLVLLDGAHNPQKMASLATTLRSWLPLDEGRERTIVLGALKSKNAQEMFAHIAPLATRMILTTPDIYGKPGADPSSLAGDAERAGFSGSVDVISDVAGAVDAAISGSGPDDQVVVTGSMYVAGNARERWFPTREIVEQRTPWPTPPTPQP